MTVDVHLGDEQGLDRSRRYLRPVARLELEGQPDDTHWSVYEWLPQFEAWATGPAICGYSTSQGPLPEGTVVTCQQCEERRPDYERYLAPGYQPDKPDEVVDAELVDDGHLPAVTSGDAEVMPARPLVDRHTILRPNAPIPTSADLPTYTEADFRISEETAELLDEAPPENTSRTYNSAREQFRKWCQQNGRVHLPCTTATFVEYVGHLIRQDKSPSTIQVAMSAIRSGHADGQQPGTKEASEAVRKHARGWAQRRTAKKATGIRTDMLAAMVATCTSETDADYPKATRDAALLTLGWGMLSRRSELAHLLIEQLTIGPTGIHVLVAFSKTDQAAKGATTFVPANADDPATCPVVRVRAWLEELRRQGVTDGPLFRHINRGGTIRHRAKGPRGDFLTPDAIGAIVKARAKLADLPDPSKVTAHGLRRGPAQEIAEAGEDPTGQGRWKPGSITVRKHYVEPAQGEANNTITAMRRKKAEQAAKYEREES